MHFSNILIAAIGIHYAQAICQSHWDGTAPFCEGSCDSAHIARQRDNCGGGSCCWSGSKVWCECKPGPSTCSNFWAGTAPFCNGECPAGFKATGRSKVGNGGLCVTGSKVLCARDGCAPSCVPGQIKFDCFLGIIGICDNGCNKYVCGGCVSGGGGSNPPPGIQAHFTDFSPAQLRSFLNSRFLDKHLEIDPHSVADDKLMELVRAHWNDSSFHLVKNNGSVVTPLPLSDQLPKVRIEDMGEIEGLSAAMGAAGMGAGQAASMIVPDPKPVFMKMEGDINVEGGAPNEL